MQSTFEALDGTCQQEGDYLLPNVEVPKRSTIGVWVSGGISSAFSKRFSVWRNRRRHCVTLLRFRILSY